MRPEDIIVRPIITEKSNEDIQSGKYTFEVARNATKIQIADAVQNLFDVRVLKVNTISVKGKMKRMGAHEGKRPDWKKAIVTIDVNPGEKSYITKGGKEVKIAKKYKDSIDLGV